MNETAENFAEMVDILIRHPAQEPTMHMNVKLRLDWDTSTLLTHMGRDHGIPGYAKFVEHCRKEKLTGDFEQFSQFGIDTDGIKILKTLYR